MWWWVVDKRRDQVAFLWRYNMVEPRELIFVGDRSAKLWTFLLSVWYSGCATTGLEADSVSTVFRGTVSTRTFRLGNDLSTLAISDIASGSETQLDTFYLCTCTTEWPSLGTTSEGSCFRFSCSWKLSISRKSLIFFSKLAHFPWALMPSSNYFWCILLNNPACRH